MFSNLSQNFVRQIVRFGIVGIAATLVHAVSGYSAVTYFGLGWPQANIIGFLIAWWVSFYGHYHFTFSAQADRLRALLRFVPHSLAMFSIGMLVTFGFSAGMPHLSESILPVIAAFVVPAISFISSKFFVFRAS